MNSFSTATLSFLLLHFQPSHSRTFDLFTAWRHRHHKTYSSDHELLHRFKIFETNPDLINRHNQKGNSSYTLASNSFFADLTQVQFRASKLGLVVTEIGDHRVYLDDDDGNGVSGDVPANVDWRKNGAVTYVKDQKSCDMGSYMCLLHFVNFLRKIGALGLDIVVA